MTRGQTHVDVEDGLHPLAQEAREIERILDAAEFNPSVEPGPLRIPALEQAIVHDIDAEWPRLSFEIHVVVPYVPTRSAASWAADVLEELAKRFRRI